jgi:transcriptional regulator with XRE-family HTH domain
MCIGAYGHSMPELAQSSRYHVCLFVAPTVPGHMQLPQIKKILLLLSFCPAHTTRPYRPYPRHWKSNQRILVQPQTLGDQIKNHRLELHWLQTDVAAKVGISSTSVSNWERGITSPSRRMMKKIQEFLDCPPERARKTQRDSFCCRMCGISNVSTQPCLFEKTCNLFIENSM